ncbi:MAG: hypothetical protein MSB10_13420 [Clostridiales bacterium]|uniref:hypothetical protein n=1 Tax=Flavonifractor porci TaxID=3133422 RepID=UPI0030AE09F9|nr:hypothetical protein [Clostridiales bacterium]
MEEHTPVSATQALEDLEACYQHFIDKLKKSKASSVGEVMGNFFRAQGNPRVSYAVEEFDAAMTERLTVLTGLLETCPAEEACRLAVQALELMLFYPVPTDHTVAFSLSAFEGRAMALLPFLSPDRQRELATRYARRTTPRQMLPNQKRLWKALSQL